MGGFPELLTEPVGRLVEPAFIDVLFMSRQGLVSHMPSAVAAFNEPVNSGFVSLVRIVINCEQIAIFVKGHFLRIPESMVDLLQSAAVRVAAEHAALIRIGDEMALLRRDMKSPVSEGKIQHTIRPPRQAMQIVPQQAGADPQSLDHNLPAFRRAITVRVLQLPEPRRIG